MSKKHSGWELKEAASRLYRALPKDSDKATFEVKFIEVVSEMLGDYVKRHDERIFVDGQKMYHIDGFWQIKRVES